MNSVSPMQKTDEDGNRENKRFCVRYLGTNCLLVQGDQTGLLIDPHFSRPSRIALLSRIAPDITGIEQALTQFEIRSLDAILLTHTHYDHALDAAETALRTGALILGSGSAVQLGRGAGLCEDQPQRVEPGSAVEVGEFSISFLSASHMPFPAPIAAWLKLNGRIEEPFSPPAWFWRYRSGMVFALLLKRNSRSLLVQGSAGVGSDTAAAAGADAAILSIGGLGLKPAKFRQRWFEENVIQPGIQRVYLSHWDDFTQPFSPTCGRIPGCQRTLRHIRRLAAQQSSLSIELLQPGEQIWI